MMVIEATGLEVIPWDKVVIGLGVFFSGLADFFIIFGGAIPYVFQYVEIYHRKNAQGFSLFVCLVLCVANILRVLFWVGKRFEWQLLAQSAVMFSAMIIMLEISTRMNRKHTPKGQRKSILGGHAISSFWAWHDLGSFMIALGVFTVFWGIITAFLYSPQSNMTPMFSTYTETLGFFSLTIEATLGMPQLIRNCQRKSTTGMSIPMVLTWLLGDIGKLAYFVLKGNPLQFVMCACLQISIDCFILGQVIAYRKNRGTSLPYDNNSPPASVVD